MNKADEILKRKEITQKCEKMFLLAENLLLKKKNEEAVEIFKNIEFFSKDLSILKRNEFLIKSAKLCILKDPVFAKSIREKINVLVAKEKKWMEKELNSLSFLI